MIRKNSFRISNRSHHDRAKAIKAPATRREFRSDWDEIEYLYHKILYWYYDRGSRRQAMQYCRRLRELLDRTTSARGSILGEECWSLVHELEGDLAAAIAARECEIDLVKQLLVAHPRRARTVHDYGPAELSDLLDLLAILHADAGDLDRAVAVLHESKELCKSKRISFGGRELLKDLEADRRIQSDQTIT